MSLNRGQKVGAGSVVIALVWWGVWVLMPSPGPEPVTTESSPALLEGSVPETCEIQATVIQDVSLINPA